jgi:hypothetical protein
LTADARADAMTSRRSRVVEVARGFTIKSARTRSG